MRARSPRAPRQAPSALAIPSVLRLGIAALAALALAACEPTAGARACLDAGALPSCEGTAPPSFAVLHAEVVSRSCAIGTTCHARDSRIGDLDLSEPGPARRRLLEQGLVVPGSPACSELAQRVLSDDRFFRMPPATRLGPEEQCAILTWIAAGAPE